MSKEALLEKRKKTGTNRPETPRSAVAPAREIPIVFIGDKPPVEQHPATRVDLLDPRTGGSVRELDVQGFTGLVRSLVTKDNKDTNNDTNGRRTACTCETQCGQDSCGGSCGAGSCAGRSCPGATCNRWEYSCGDCRR